MEQGNNVRSPPHTPTRRNYQRKCVMNWPQFPFPILLHRWGGGQMEKCKWSWAWEEGRQSGETVFSFGCLSSLSQFAIHEFSKVRSVSPMAVIAEWSLAVPTWTTNISVYFFFPFQLKMGCIEQLWWAPGIQPRSTHLASSKVNGLFLHCDRGNCSVPKSVQVFGVFLHTY